MGWEMYVADSEAVGRFSGMEGLDRKTVASC